MMVSGSMCLARGILLEGVYGLTDVGFKSGMTVVLDYE